MANNKALGFGFVPMVTQHHFLVVIPRSQNGKVLIFERFAWDNGNEQKTDVHEGTRKAEISRKKWKMIEPALAGEFNRRLKENNTGAGRWVAGEVPVERLLGKEMVLLVWAIEDSDPSVVDSAIKNWSGLSKEERWWLFTMTNASTGHAHDKRGWRKAIRYALTENPVDEEGLQGNLMEYLYSKE